LLESADVVVVDGSANSMDYMYSLGVRHALSDKPTIVFVEEHFVPFDVTIWRGVHHIKDLSQNNVYILRCRVMLLVWRQR
jgi:hypothetical protein